MIGFRWGGLSWSTTLVPTNPARRRLSSESFPRQASRNRQSSSMVSVEVSALYSSRISPPLFRYVSEFEGVGTNSDVCPRSDVFSRIRKWRRDLPLHCRPFRSLTAALEKRRDSVHSKK